MFCIQLILDVVWAVANTMRYKLIYLLYELEIADISTDYRN